MPNLRSGRFVTTAGGAVNGLLFPQNGAAPTSTLVAFQFSGANLINAWPATYIWRVKPEQQNGYYTTFFWGPSGAFTGAGYYGAHPYPNSPPSGSVHKWEISIDGTDYVTDDNANDTTVTKGQWYTQALRVTAAAGNELDAVFYWDLATNVNRVISFNTDPDDFALGFPPASPAFTVGDAPWNIANERLNGTLGAFKMMDASLTESEIVQEAADMTQLVTATAIANRWWFKSTYSSVDDLTDSVTGVVATWNNANKATLVEDI